MRVRRILPVLAFVSLLASADGAAAPGLGFHPPQVGATPLETRSVIQFRPRRSDCESGLWIDQVEADGAILILSDGSVWRVDPMDTITSAIWLPISDVLVCGNRIINLDDREAVSARRIR